MRRVRDIPALRRVWPVLLVVGLAGMAGPAQAQGGSGLLLFGFGGGKVLSETNIPTQASGELVVSFHGDATAGCATYGLCAYAGTILVRPSGGQLGIVTYRRGSRIAHAAFLGLGPGAMGYTTSARVQRSTPGSPAGTCADAASGIFSSVPIGQSHRGSFTIRALAPGGSLLQTRCAGPLDGDLAAASPAVAISLARALRGRTTLDLTGTRTFAAHGFAGTITSTLVLKLGKPSTASSSSPTFPPGIKTQRIRTITEQLSFVRMSGGLSLSVRGSDDPIACRLLDTCGLGGTLSLPAGSPELSAQVLVQGPASRPYSDFLTALGVSTAGHAHGITVAVVVNWLGHVRAAMTQASATCTDVAQTGGGSVAIGSLSGVSGGYGAFAGSWRSRCPGPELQPASGGLKGSLAPGALTHGRFTVTVRPRGSFADDGYVITPRGRISLVLRRGRISSQVFEEPVS